ncbi:hypothetical protein TKK_0002217 [Trichogramma kaykai]
MAANARPERMVTLGRIPAQSVRKQLANEGVMVSRKVVTEVAGSEVTVRGGQPGETGIDGQHLMYVSIPEKMIGANNPGTWDDSNEDPFWIEVPIKLTKNQKRRVRKARLEQLQARPLPTLAQFLPQPQAPVEIPVLPGVGAGKGPVEGSRAEGPVLEEEIGLEDISLSGLDISEEMEEQLLMETEPSQVAGNAAVNTERAQRVEDAAWKKYEANIEKARKIVGCYFGSLVLVPWTEGVDPEIGACFKCHRMGHVHAECTVPVDVPFCKNCGRKGVTVCRCPRCRLAWKRQKGEWMRGRKPKKSSPLQSEGRVMVTIPSTPPVVQESERPVEATMNERTVRWQDDRRGRSPVRGRERSRQRDVDFRPRRSDYGSSARYRSRSRSNLRSGYDSRRNDGHYRRQFSARSPSPYHPRNRRGRSPARSRDRRYGQRQEYRREEEHPRSQSQNRRRVYLPPEQWAIVRGLTYAMRSLPRELYKISYGSEKNSEEEFSISSDDKNGDEIQYEEPNFGITSTYLKKDQAVQANLFSNEMTPVGGYISEKVFKQVMERVINKLSRIEIMVQNSKEGSKEIEHDQEKSLLPRFPLKSEADINDLNYLLENSEAARKKFKTYIKRVGGKSLGDTMRASLKDIVDDTFLDSSFTWSGNTRESSEGEPLKKRDFQNEVFLKELVGKIV